MRVCANMHDINTNNNVIHTHISYSWTSTYGNIRLITNILKLKMAKFVSTLRCGEITVNSWPCRIKLWPMTYFFILMWVIFIVALCRKFNECTQMYVNVRLHTTMYDILRHDIHQCTTMFRNVRQKLLPYDSIFVAPKSLTYNFFLNSQHYPRKHRSHCEQPRAPTTTHEKLRISNSQLVAP